MGQNRASGGGSDPLERRKGLALGGALAPVQPAGESETNSRADGRALATHQPFERYIMQALVYNGPRNVSIKNVPDARIERPTDVLVKITTHRKRPPTGGMSCSKRLRILKHPDWLGGDSPAVQTLAPQSPG